MRAAAIAENLGITAVAIASSGFLLQARAIAKGLGIPDAHIVEYPGTIPMDSIETVRAKATTAVAPAVVARLVEGDHAAGGSGTSSIEPGPRDVVFTGALEAVTEHFEERLWTDGLPIVPPTLDRVERFLAMTPHGAEDILGVLAPEYREATVWSVAVNGVMAGCRPEHMPILLAAVEAIADPGFRLQDAGSTPGWEPLVVLSGPMVERLRFNTASGLMRVGNRAATSIGRFLRLYMRNAAGLRTPPGRTDKAAVGATFNVALAEDDAVTRSLGWQPLRMERGYGFDDDLVTVQSVVAISPPMYTGTEDPENHLELLAYFLGTTTGPWFFTALLFQRWAPLLLLSPAVARVLADRGLGKDDVRRYLGEHAKIRARWLEVYPGYAGADLADLRNYVADGTADARFAGTDPERLVPVVLDPATINIVVAGDSGRNQSRFYVNNHEQGYPTSKLVRWP